MSLTGTVVLNVNDAEATRYTITRVLQKAGFAVLEAPDGRTGLELARRHRPKVIVLDVKLPDISGLDVCRLLKEDPATRPLKVLHTSAVFTATEYKVQSLECGADGYLTHPFEQEELIAMVRSLLRLTDAEQQLRDQAEELRAANRRTNEFLAMLAHELRNPLAAIVASLPVLSRGEPTDSPERTARELIKRQARHLTRLVEDLLDVGRVTQGKIELKWQTVDLTALLQRAAVNLRQTRANERQQTLRVALPARPVCVRGDVMRLEQVFSNLLDNASKYTDEGGEIQVELADLHSGRDSERARVIVRDSGIGMSAATLPTIFNLFSQADVPLARSRGGLGIGLTLVKTLVSLHGGTVVARSKGEGQGSEFEVLLPLLADSQVEAVAHDSSDAADEASVARRVLLVEDNPDAQLSMKCLLEMWGHEVFLASEGVTGVSAALALQPDIALIDIGLPQIDGYEVARRIRKAPEGCKLLLVALTGYGAPEQRARALEAGFDLHLVKPVEPEQLSRLVAECANIHSPMPRSRSVRERFDTQLHD